MPKACTEAFNSDIASKASGHTVTEMEVSSVFNFHRATWA